MQLMVHVYLNFVVEFDGMFKYFVYIHFLLFNLFRVATIYSLAFSPDSLFLASSSNTGTIHIFRLMNQAEKYDYFYKDLFIFEYIHKDHQTKQVHGWVHLVVYWVVLHIIYREQLQKF